LKLVGWMSRSKILILAYLLAVFRRYIKD
jgi:hypothetical protein